MKYQRVVIGNGSDAVDAAIAAAGQMQTVALIRSADGFQDRVTGTILRRAAERLIKTEAVSIATLRSEVIKDVQSQMNVEQSDLARAGVSVFSGNVRLVDAHTIAVQSTGCGEGEGTEFVSGQTIVLACGTQPAPLGRTPFDGKLVLTAADIIALDQLPRTMIVIGAGRMGLENAIVLALLGVEVTVVDDHSHLFELCGGLMAGPLVEAQSLDIAMRLGDEAIGIEKRSAGTGVAVRLASGRVLTAGAVLVCVGRHGRTAGLELESAGVGLDEHGRVWCDSNGRTWVPNISAVGDVVGFRPRVMAG